MRVNVGALLAIALQGYISGLMPIVYLDEESYIVTVPTLPDCIIQGETMEEAIEMAKDAIRLHIESLVADGQPIPKEAKHPHGITIDVAA